MMPIFVRFVLWLLSFTPSERVALFAAFLVLVGVLGEEVAELKSLEGDEKSRLRNRVKRWSIAILLLGLAGDVEAIVKGQAEMAEITKQAGDAATSAHSAASDAANAKTEAAGARRESGEAITKAGEAKSKAQDADGEAAQAEAASKTATAKSSSALQDAANAEHQVEAVEIKRAALEKSLHDFAICNTPRVMPWGIMVGGKQWPSVNPLRPFAPYKAIIEYLSGDAEAKRAANHIAKALTTAGWDIIEFSPHDNLIDGVEIEPFLAPVMPDGGPTGEWMLLENSDERSREAADALVDFLHSFNWQARTSPPVDENGRLIRDLKVMPPDSLRIQVGLYPAVEFVASPANKPLADAIAQFEKEREQDSKQTEAEHEKHDEQILKTLSPQDAKAFMAARDEWNRENKEVLERFSEPCQPLEPLQPTMFP